MWTTVAVVIPTSLTCLVACACNTHQLTASAHSTTTWDSTIRDNTGLEQEIRATPPQWQRNVINTARVRTTSMINTREKWIWWKTTKWCWTTAFPLQSRPSSRSGMVRESSETQMLTCRKDIKSPSTAPVMFGKKVTKKELPEAVHRGAWAQKSGNAKTSLTTFIPTPISRKTKIPLIWQTYERITAKPINQKA